MSKKNSIFAADLGAKALRTYVHTHVPLYINIPSTPET